MTGHIFDLNSILCLLYSQTLQKIKSNGGLGGKGGAPAKDLPLIGQELNQQKNSVPTQFYVHLYLKNGGGGGGNPPSPPGSDPFFEKSSFICNGSQRANEREKNDMDFQFDE